MDLSGTIIPRSDQLNAEDFLSGPRTFTITRVRVLDSPDQPVHVYLDGLPDRPFKPSKTVRRLLVVGWGVDSAAYVGKRITLYRDPEVKWGGQDVGGIRVSHMSGLAGPLNVALTVTRGRRAPYTVDVLPDGPAPAGQQEPGWDLSARAVRMVEAFAALGVTEDDLDRAIGRPRAGWAVDDLDRMAGVFRSMDEGGVTRDAAFPRPEVTADDLPPDPGGAPPIKDPPPTLPADPNPVTLPDKPAAGRHGPTQLLADLGVTDKGDGLALTGLYIGRPVGKFTDLTTAEREKVVAALQTMVDAAPDDRAADLARDLTEARQVAAERDPQ